MTSPVAAAAECGCVQVQREADGHFIRIGPRPASDLSVLLGYFSTVTVLLAAIAAYAWSGRMAIQGSPLVAQCLLTGFSALSLAGVASALWARRVRASGAETLQLLDGQLVHCQSAFGYTREQRVKLADITRLGWRAPDSPTRPSFVWVTIRIYSDVRFALTIDEASGRFLCEQLSEACRSVGGAPELVGGPNLR